MKDNGPHSLLQESFAEIFTHLRGQDIEQFYAHYQLWVMRHRIPILENEIEALRADIVENRQRVQNLQLSAIALAVLARLQANGVSDIGLLDQMLERGEDWLDSMMQRLDYCEQVEDFIQGDYTQWCANSLEGAYDWIDTMRGSLKEGEAAPQAATVSSEAEVQATAELLLHKLSFDDEEAMRDLTHNPQPTTLANEESFEPVENPTYAQALEILGNEGTVPADRVYTEAEPEIVAQASEQPAPWYSINLEETNEPFDFEHPHSMDDWIKILQAETSASQETAEELRAATGSTPETPVAPQEKVTQAANELPLATETSVESEQGAYSEMAAETTLVEAEPAEFELEQEKATGEQLEIVQEAISPEKEADHRQSEALEPVAEVETEQRETKEGPKSGEKTKARRYEARKGLKPKKKTEARRHEAETVQEHEAEAGHELANAAVVPVEEEATDIVVEDILSYTREEEATGEITERIATPINDQPVDGQEVAGVEEQTLVRPAEGVAEEPDWAGQSALELQQSKIEEAAIVNAIFEPEEEQRPWYDYLVIDKTVSGELQSFHELAEHSLLNGEHLNHQEGPLDETQPMARKEIQLAQEEPRMSETALPTTISEPVPETVDEESAEEREQAAVKSLEEQRIESEALAVHQVEVAVQSEMVSEPRVTDKAEPVQESPKKVGFWQRLFGRRPKK